MVSYKSQVKGLVVLQLVASGAEKTSLGEGELVGASFPLPISTSTVSDSMI